jgi:hypothetical protein
MQVRLAFRERLDGDSAALMASSPDPPKPDGFRDDPVSWVVAALALVSLATWTRFAANGMWGDDWALYADALRGTGLAEPIASHFRPLARLQFAALALVPSAAAFHLLSLGVHLLACWSVWRYLRSRESKRLARITSLLFAGFFLGNEAIYWISATGPILCLTFVMLAARAWREWKPLSASAFLLVAALSYELWLVGLVLLLFEGKRPWRHLAGPAAVFGLFLGVSLFVVGGHSLMSYGGPSAANVIPRMALGAFRAVSPLSSPPGYLLGLLTIAAMAALGLLSRYRVPVAFYFAAVAVLSLSSQVASRFYYVPQLALAWIAARAAEDVRWARFAGAALAVWMGIVGAFVNLRDGEDYQRFSRFHEEIVARIAGATGPLREGDVVEIVDRTPDDTVLRMAAAVVGRPKLYFPRPGAIHGAIYAADLATIVFSRQGYRAEAVAAGSERRVEVGGVAPARVSAFRATAGGS